MFQTEHKPLRAALHVCVVILLTVCAGYGQFGNTRQLTSNNILALAGNGDTVWIATERGLNYQISLDDKKEWRGFEMGDIHDRFCGLAFGGGAAAVLIYNAEDRFTFWHANHKNGEQQSVDFRFSGFTDKQYETAVPSGGPVFFDNKFWVPFGDGGVICYDPANNKVTALRPDEDAVSPENLPPPADKDSSRALSVSVYGNGIMVTTPYKLWNFDSQNKSWSAELAVSDIDSPQKVISFNAAFAADSGLYAFVNVKNNDKEETAFYRNGGGLVGNKWDKALNNTPLAVFPAPRERFFVLFEKNQVSVFAAAPAQTLWDEDEKLNAHGFRTMLGKAGDDPDPKVNDILFLPATDSVGTLIVATSSGLYFSKSVNPISGVYPDMTLVRHIRQIGSKESYALPGIIRGGSDGIYEKAVFVYKLKKNGNVTIRVYDYNMNHVKTVVNGARREAERPSGRSTVPEADFWDGKNKAGKKVSPGVYYYKITSTGGDRFFGKVILAK